MRIDYWEHKDVPHDGSLGLNEDGEGFVTLETRPNALIVSGDVDLEASFTDEDKEEFDTGIEALQSVMGDKINPVNKPPFLLLCTGREVDGTIRGMTAYFEDDEELEKFIENGHIIGIT